MQCLHVLMMVDKTAVADILSTFNFHLVCWEKFWPVTMDGNHYMISLDNQTERGNNFQRELTCHSSSKQAAVQ